MVRSIAASIVAASAAAYGVAGCLFPSVDGLSGADAGDAATAGDAADAAPPEEAGVPSLVLALDAGTVTCIAADDNSIYFTTSALEWLQASNVDGSNLHDLTGSGFASSKCAVDAVHTYAVNGNYVASATIGGTQGGSPLLYAPDSLQSFVVTNGAVWATVPNAGQVGCGSCAASTQTGTFNAVVSGLQTPYGIAANPSGTTIFWTNDGDGTIASVSSNSLANAGSPTTLVSSLEQPNSIAADATSIYWSTGDNLIMRAAQDGSGVTTLATLADGSAPNDVAIDGSYVYWRDANLNDIERVPTAGGSAPMVVASAPTLTAIAVPPGTASGSAYVYYATGSPASILRVHK